MRRANRRDEVHGDIVSGLRTIGCIVIDTSRVGGGAPDAFVWHRRCGWRAMEFKTPKKGRLSDVQKELHAQVPIDIVTSLKEALTIVGVST